MLIAIGGCSPVRHVPDGEYLLDKVSINVNDSTGKITESDLINYLAQLPNHKILWTCKLQLGIYNMSGKDSTKWYNRLARNLGQAPVIYDSRLTEQSRLHLLQALINKGYIHAAVDLDTIGSSKKKKMKVNYNLTPGELYNISTVDYTFSDDSIKSVVMEDTISLPLTSGTPFDRDMLELHREMIAQRLRDNGYFGFSKEYITFNADTTYKSNKVDLTVEINVPEKRKYGEQLINADKPYTVKNVFFIMDYDPTRMFEDQQKLALDSVAYKDIDILYGNKRYLRPSVLYENCFIRKNEIYSDASINKTYEALNRLGILKFVNIKSRPVDDNELDVYVLLTPGKSQSVGFELEGTNSEGDLGVGASISYSHANIGKGSETFTTKFRAAYESLSGNLEGFINNRYMEYSLDMGLNFPKFKFPFLRDSFKRKIRATTELNTSVNYQERPEYTRVIANLGWSYKWTEKSNSTRHIFTPIDIDYVYLPKSTINFIDEIASDNPLLRYSYEDHFIMRLGYSYYHTNKKNVTNRYQIPQSSIYTIHVKAEMAGNLLFAINSIFTHRSDFHDNPYKIFGIHYAQYLKAEADYSTTRIFDWRNSLAFHAGFGIIYPYGNSSVVPFEKRFYGGGANGVRGWDVRTLGPGSFDGSNSVTNFINQCGDIRLDLNLEYRAKLFWVIELGAFIDAGNIWTIHNYANQPGGFFKFNSFYKEIAAAYGLGIRLDFSYFLLRFDLGMKAHNPAMGQEPWPLLHPRWGRDSSFHFSIGYPF
jgi:outer membrane protein assembly factor BamA